MSFCKVFGKDKVIFATKEDHAVPSTVKLPPPEPPQGIFLENGEINWSCPCLGGMATGPCCVEFREAFTCFHNSQNKPKGSDCYEAFRTMHDCLSRYPTIYGRGSDEDDDNPMGAVNIPDLAVNEESEDGKRMEPTNRQEGETDSKTSEMQAKNP